VANTKREAVDTHPSWPKRTEKMDHVRIGLIGTSWWAERMYLPSLASHPKAKIVAICGRDATHAELVAKAYAIPQVFTDYRELLQAELDAVAISVPDDLHHPIALAALDTGLHVLCEKPLANNVAEAKEMTDRAVASGVVHMVLFTWRWQPHWRYVKRLIEEGFLGRCYQARFAFTGGLAREPKYHWRLDGARATGIVGDLGSHMIDLSRWMLGEETQRVIANLPVLIDRSRISGHSSPVNDAASVTLELTSGAQVLIQASGVAHLGTQENRVIVELHGEAGTIEAEHIFAGRNAGVVLRGIRRDETEFQTLSIPDEFLAGIDPGAMMDPYLKHSAGPRHFIDAVTGGKPATPDFSDGLKVQQVLDAAFKSHRERRWVDVGRREYPTRVNYRLF
jgi:predicted dehydrogenase